MRCFSFLFSLLIPLVAAGQTPPPNIVFFFVDDMGWQDTSVAFHTKETDLNRDYRTPHMKRLAEQGQLFTDAYACAICSPSRVSLMTGLNAARHKVTCWTLRRDKSPEGPSKTLRPPEWNVNGLQPTGAGIPRSVEADCLPALLKAAGYHTIHAGKGHFGAKDTPGADPSHLGFTSNIAGSYMGGPGSYHGDKNFSAAWRGGDRIWDVPGLDSYHGQKINLTEAITRESIKVVESCVKEKRPFYLYLSHYAVHAPFEADRRFLPNYDGEQWSKHKKTYASMLESMDHSLGDILKTLERLGVEDNTIVIFMSDNGSPQQNPANLPLRGHKISAYEGGSRVPLLVKWPGVTKAGSRSKAPVIIEDLFPTILEMARVEVPAEIDGMSFTELLRNPATDRFKRPLFWHYPNLYHLPPFSSVRLGHDKLIYWHATGKRDLYDLKTDLGEKIDLSDQAPELVQKLSKLLSSHLRETKALLPIDLSSGKAVPYPDDL
jgi:arylsulfatase A-like enzyme